MLYMIEPWNVLFGNFLYTVLIMLHKYFYNLLNAPLELGAC